jgi:hypothetical protein
MRRRTDSGCSWQKARATLDGITGTLQRDPMLVEVGLLPRGGRDLDLPFEKVFRYCC